MSFHYSFDSDIFDTSIFDNFPIGEFSRIFAFVLITSLIIGLLVGLVVYIIHSIAVYHIAKRRDIKAPWLAWIPVARVWTLGAIADEFDRRTTGYDRRFRIFYIVLYSVYIIVTFSVIAVFLGAASAIVSTDMRSIEEVFEAVIALIGASTGFSSYIIYIYLLNICIQCIISFKIYDSLNPRLALIFTLLYVVVPLFAPISLLCMKNKGYPEAEPAPEIPEAVKLGWYNQD